MVPKAVKHLFLYSVGHTYGNLSRLFLRLFTGVMFLQFGMRQILHFNEIAPTFSGFWGISPELSITLVVVIELLSATCIILGLLTRIAVVPAFVLMGYVESLLMGPVGVSSNQLFIFQPGYPVMVMGIFIYMMLAGPGKISIDYLIALLLDRNKEDDEVLEKA